MENLANVFEAVKPKMTRKKRIDKIGDKIVYLVDGDYIRDYVDIQFTNVGQHWRFNFIPPNEIWIDKDTNSSEWPFFIDHQIWERRMMKDYKMSYRKALEYADQKERDERHSAGGLSKDVKPRPNVDVERKYWKKVGDAKVYLVSGKKVRQGYYLDFTGGGHGYVYGFIPKDEIWIEKEVKAEREKSFDLIHEVTERDQMKLGMSYAKAHDHASKVENLARRTQQEKDAA